MASYYLQKTLRQIGFAVKIRFGANVFGLCLKCYKSFQLAKVLAGKR